MSRRRAIVGTIFQKLYTAILNSFQFRLLFRGSTPMKVLPTASAPATTASERSTQKRLSRSRAGCHPRMKFDERVHASARPAHGPQGARAPWRDARRLLGAFTSLGGFIVCIWHGISLSLDAVLRSPETFVHLITRYSNQLFTQGSDPCHVCIENGITAFH